MQHCSRFIIQHIKTQYNQVVPVPPDNRLKMIGLLIY